MEYDPVADAEVHEEYISSRPLCAECGECAVLDPDDTLCPMCRIYRHPRPVPAEELGNIPF